MGPQEQRDVNQQWIRQTVDRVLRLPPKEAQREWIKSLEVVRRAFRRKHPNWHFTETGHA